MIKDKINQLAIVILALCLLPAIAFASPFLVCDPMTGVEQTQVTLDGEPQGWVPYAEQDFGGTTYCVLMDLAGLANGSHTATAEADWGVWGASDPSVPFDFSKPDVQAPAGFVLMP